MAEPRSILSHEEIARRAALEEGGGGAYATEIFEPPVVVVAPEIAAQVEFEGLSVSYVYPEAVDLRDGVDRLRLELGTMAFTADLMAEAVPARDATAYLMARLENTQAETLLPGPSVLYRDGALVGTTDVPLTPSGAELRLGFGPIDGLQIRRDVIAQSEGDVGLISTSNQRVRQIRLQVENLTEQDWEVILREGLSYSEQDDLVVHWEAEPEITRRAPENRRGIVEWDLTVAAGQVSIVEVVETLEWPEGYDLR